MWVSGLFEELLLEWNRLEQRWGAGRWEQHNLGCSARKIRRHAKRVTHARRARCCQMSGSYGTNVTDDPRINAREQFGFWTVSGSTVRRGRLVWGLRKWSHPWSS